MRAEWSEGRGGRGGRCDERGWKEKRRKEGGEMRGEREV